MCSVRACVHPCTCVSAWVRACVITRIWMYVCVLKAINNGRWSRLSCGRYTSFVSTKSSRLWLWGVARVLLSTQKGGYQDARERGGGGRGRGGRGEGGLLSCRKSTAVEIVHPPKLSASAAAVPHRRLRCLVSGWLKALIRTMHWPFLRRQYWNVIRSQ